MKKWVQGIGAGLLLSGALWLSAGCVAVDPGYAGGGGGGGYDYDYYPDSDIYFYPQGHLYYWNEDGRWRSGRDLPHRYDLREHPAEHFRGHSQQPWTEHRSTPRSHRDERR